jgi:hypothetical protein
LKILITSATSAQAYQLKSKLNNPNTILGDYAELPATMLKAGNMITLPKPTDPSYAHKMLTLSLDNQIEAIYALQSAELNLLNEAGLLFKEYGITILSADEVQ